MWQGEVCVTYPKTWAEWEAKIGDEQATIEDQYGRVVSIEEMLANIMARDSGLEWSYDPRKLAYVRYNEAGKVVGEDLTEQELRRHGILPGVRGLRYMEPSEHPLTIQYSSGDFS